jgi:hypothetical protein
MGKPHRHRFDLLEANASNVLKPAVEQLALREDLRSQPTEHSFEPSNSVFDPSHAGYQFKQTPEGIYAGNLGQDADSVVTPSALHRGFHHDTEFLNNLSAADGSDIQLHTRAHGGRHRDLLHIGAFSASWLCLVHGINKCLDVL